MLALVFALIGCHSSRSALPAQESGKSPTENIDGNYDDAQVELPPELLLYPPGSQLPVSAFGEVWAYLVSGREQALDNNYPISDLCYFGADVDSYGKLCDVPNFRNLAGFAALSAASGQANGPARRLHLVSACGGRALTHFVLAEGSRERRELIRDLLEAAKPYHGLQIDYENVPARDGEAFLSFLRELRAGLGGKMLSVALPARTRVIKDDVYDYEKIKPIVDRILVMAYDEHWSTSEPGPIASMGWCQRVANHAVGIIGGEKLIMGLPFYGRSWGSVNANKAYLHSGIEELMQERNIADIRRENGIPTFNYEFPLSVTVYYEDDYSLSARLEMYKRLGVGSVGFWRLGQETPAFWPLIRLEKNN